MTDAGRPQTAVDLPDAVAPRVVELGPGATFDLRIHPVMKSIGDGTFRMLSYDGSIPGPILRVKQGSEVEVRVTNDTEMETTVHWHGLRLENRYDGVPHDTQRPIEPGGSYTHRLTFPDAGLFWYHPHMREDYAQEMGLYGNIIVEPSDADHWPLVDREIVLTLDDILIEGDEIASFDPHHATFAAMGRFGNVLLTAGETEPRLEVRGGEVIRLLLTNTANTRVFKVAAPGARMKMVGGDGGRVERESFVDDVVIAPSERVLVDVVYEKEGAYVLEHRTPERIYRLATIEVAGDGLAPAGFDDLRVDQEMTGIRPKLEAILGAAPDRTLALIAEMDLDDAGTDGPVVYVCPMHPEVRSDEPGSCPECGMKLMPQPADAKAYSCPMHPDVVSTQPGHCPQCGMKLMPSIALPETMREQGPHDGEHDHHAQSTSDGIEWEDDMVEVNRATTPENMRWKLVDRDTGKENADIDWVFREGDQVKIRLVNEMESDHPMHHPFHIHGERFLVVARDGVAEDNLVWKDTVLLRTGETVDILMDASNPGLWMAHCHIAEHMESGMMFNFRVTPSG